ncbi:hypothetical protein D3C87_323280 [compost metagenome]
MKLYILVNSCGDGSYSLRYTLDGALIERLQNFDGCGYEHAGFDADGFNPKSINVPDDSTYVSLGISLYSIAGAEDYEGLE